MNLGGLDSSHNENASKYEKYDILKIEELYPF